MRYFSMFTGVGGFELGIEQAYEHYCDKHQVQTKSTNGESLSLSGSNHVQEPLCVGFSEIDKYASQLLQIKYPTVKNYGDATTINPEQLPDFDLLVGGFPCQSFSIAGKRKGFNDTRGTLFFDIARILAYKKPSHLVLENVKGLLSHDGGETFQTIIGVLTDLGYFVEWQVLNSKNFGVPQNRERVFIVGHLGGQPKSKVFPVGENDSLFDGRQRQVSPTITSRYYKQGQTDPYLVRADKPSPLKGGDMPHNPNSIRRVSYTDGARIRRLTPLECERLQGFPDGYTEGFSDTQRYKMMGNAVTVNVIKYLISKIFL